MAVRLEMLERTFFIFNTYCTCTHYTNVTFVRNSADTRSVYMSYLYMQEMYAHMQYKLTIYFTQLLGEDLRVFKVEIYFTLGVLKSNYHCDQYKT